MDHVETRMASGAAWMIAMRLSIRLLGLLSTVILARLLLPEAFGLVSLASGFVAALAVFTEFDFATVLIQKQRASREDYDTAWTLSIIRGMLTAALLVASASFLGEFFREPRLAPVMHALAASVFLEAMQNIGVVDFRKHLNFAREFHFNVLSRLVGFFVTAPLAFLWRDHRALVAGIIAASTTKLMLSYIMHSFRPRLTFSRFLELMSVSKWLLANSLASFLHNRSDTFILGKIAGASQLGIYSVAYELANLPTTEIVSPIRRALLPGYAKLAEHRDELARRFAESLSLILIVGLPIALGIGCLAEWLVPVLLGKQWHESVPLVRTLSILGAINVCAANTWPVYLALGEVRVLACLVWFGALFTVPVVATGASWDGAGGAAVAATVAAAFLLVLNLATITRILRVKLMQILRATWRSFAATAFMVGTVRWITAPWTNAEGMLAQLTVLIAASCVGAAVYVVVHAALWLLSRRAEGPEHLLLDWIRSGKESSWAHVSQP